VWVVTTSHVQHAELGWDFELKARGRVAYFHMFYQLTKIQR
jgi:hypothetical protein